MVFMITDFFFLCLDIGYDRGDVGCDNNLHTGGEVEWKRQWFQWYWKWKGGQEVHQVKQIILFYLNCVL